MASASNSSGSGGEELYRAALCLRESMRWIQVQEDKMAGSSAVYKLHEVESDLLELFGRISHQAHSETQERVGLLHLVNSLKTQSKLGDDGVSSSETQSKTCDDDGMEPTWAQLVQASQELGELLHRAAVQTHMWIGQYPKSEELLNLAAKEIHGWVGSESEELLDLAAKETDGRIDSVSEQLLGRIVGQADDLISIPKFIRVMSKFREVAGDIAPVFQEEQTRKEALAVLTFGFSLQLFSKQIDELWREMCRLLRSFSPENKDIMRTMIMLTSQQYVRGICKLQWISERISMLQEMDPDFDSKVKSMSIELKSESFLSAMEKLEEESRREGRGDQEDFMEMEEKRFTAYRLYWERTWGNTDHFEEQTLLSSMLFTHCTPRRIPIEAVAGSTLQFYSVKVSTTDKISFPLEVYGVVAARDAVDRCRNPLFLRTRNFCQILTEQEPFLRLTGPTRAIVSIDTVYIEIQLIVKGATKDEDKALISTFYLYSGGGSPQIAKNIFCTLELCNEQLKRSVQATILSVLVTAEAGSLPFPYGGRVICCSLPRDVNDDIAVLSSRQIVILDLEGGRMPVARTGYLDLSRHVVSVELNGQLKVHMEAYSQMQSESTRELIITPQKCNVSKHKCYFSAYQVEISIAWSFIPWKPLF